MATFDLLQTTYTLVSHSHILFICKEGGKDVGFEVFYEDIEFALGDEWLIVDSGDIGQPCYRDPRPGYVIYDAGRKTVERRGVTYNEQATQGKVRMVGLPELLIDRLNFGR